METQLMQCTHHIESFNYMYINLELHKLRRMLDVVVQKENSIEDRNRGGLGQLYIMIFHRHLAQTVKYWTTHSACKSTSYSTSLDIIYAAEDQAPSEFNDWGDVNLTLLNTKVETHIFDTNTVVLQFLTNDPCLLEKRISQNLVIGFSICFHMLIKF